MLAKEQQWLLGKYLKNIARLCVGAVWFDTAPLTRSTAVEHELVIISLFSVGCYHLYPRHNFNGGLVNPLL